MAGSVNKVILVGNVGRDPEIRSTQDGTRVANLSLATSETWRDKNSGERKERTEWHRIVIFNERLVDVVEKYVKKGAKLYIEGALQRFRGELTMLDSRGGGGMGGSAGDDMGSSGSGSGGMGGARGGGSSQDLDDEIPF